MALGTLLVALVAGLVWHQRLEKDEGYLAEGAWLVAQGRAPYRDFVFPQQPYFTLVYGALLRVVGPSLIWPRALSAAFFLALGALVFLFVRRHARDPGLARWAALFFCFNTHSLYWHTRARQYVLADLLLFAGLLLVAEARGSASPRRGIVSSLLGGVAAGAAAHVRLLLGPAAVALAVLAGLGSDTRWSWARSAAFACGVLIGSLPFLWLLALDPAAWLTNTYGLQVLLRPSPAPGEMLLRAGFVLSEFFARPETALLAALAASALLPGRDALRSGGRLALVVLVAVAGTVLLAHPVQSQYLVETLPFLSVLAACGWARLLARLEERALPARLLSVGLLLFFVGFGGYRAALRILYDHHNDPQLGMASFLAYQEGMNQYVRSDAMRSDDRVLLAWWSGYLLVEGVQPYPGAELGRPAERGVGRMSREEFAARGLRHPDQIAEELRAGVPRFVVAGYQAPENAAELLAARYRRRAHFGAIEVYERCPVGEGDVSPVTPPQAPVDVILLTPPREIVSNLAHDARVVSRLGAYPPLGLACLAGALEADGERVSILDLAERPVPRAALATELRRLAPRVVGIGSMTVALRTVGTLLEVVREALPEALLVLGGPCMEDYPVEVLRRFPTLDLAVVGEGEATLREIVARQRAGRELRGIEGTVYRREGEVVAAPPRAPVRDLDSLPRPAYRLLDFSRYSPVISRGRGFATMFAMRGCPFDCGYCHRQTWLRHARYHSASRVVDEMEHLVRELGVREIKFYDDTFTLDMRRAFEICRAIRERGLLVPWEIRTRAELLTPDLVRALAEAGCYRICIGVEGGSDERLTRMGRTTRVAQVRDAFRWARESSLSTLGFFMIGYPGDSRRDCEDVLRLAREIEANWIVVAVTTAYANTEVYRRLLDSGRLPRDVWRDFTLGTLDEIDERDLTFDGIDYSRDQLASMLSRLYWRYYLRPGQIARVLREIRSPRQVLNLGRMALAFVAALVKTR